MGSREVSEKASALVLIGTEWQNDTEWQDRRLRRKIHDIDNPSSISAMVDNVHVFVGIGLIDT